MAAVAVAFGAGILTVEYSSLPVTILAALIALLTALAITRSHRRAALVIVAAAFVTGAARHHVSLEIPPTDISHHQGGERLVRGVIVSDPEALQDRIRLVLRADRVKTGTRWHRATGELMLSIHANPNGKPIRLEYGDRVQVGAYLYAPRDNTNPSRFSWRTYLARQGIRACASVKSAKQITMLPGRRGCAVVRGALAAKRYITASIQRIHPAEEASVVAGMVLGTYAYLPPDVMLSFQRTGTLHLLAASGYNCYIILFLANPILKRMGIVPKYRHAAVICLIVVYLLMVGPKPSLLRASVMAAVLLMALPLGRAADVVNTFFVTGLVLLAMNPANLFDVGFQLSFLAVAGLIAVSPVIESLFYRAGWMGPGMPKQRRSLAAMIIRKVTSPIAAAAVGTVAVSLATAPLVACYFNYVSIVSLPANMAMALGVPLVFADGVLSAVAAPIGPLGSAVGYLGSGITQSMLSMLDCLGSMRWSAVSVASPEPAAIAGYYVLLYAAVSFVRSQHDVTR